MLSATAASWLIILWFVAIGAAVGSFLNVVVYRLPLGISLSNPPSHCPTCKQRIRWYDNVPVLGWIKLRGRCRSCHSPISVRYPLVEALAALMFGVLAAVEFLSAGDNLPFRPLATISESPIIAVYLYHITLLCTLLAAALIEIDGKRPPARLFTFAIAVGLVTPLFWPTARPWGALWPWADWAKLPLLLVGVADGAAGLAVGLALAGLASLWSRLSAPLWGRLSTCQETPSATNTLSFTCVAVFLGWQAAVALAMATGIATVIVRPLQRVWPRLRFPTSAALTLLSLVWILLWVRLVSPWEP
ncbi:MAG: prepilin peptidase [Planctomycetaceae bacterium]|nr:prepilin peptidase [Planctomycetaceae bacterium]